MFVAASRDAEICTVYTNALLPFVLLLRIPNVNSLRCKAVAIHQNRMHTVLPILVFVEKVTGEGEKAPRQCYAAAGATLHYGRTAQARRFRHYRRRCYGNTSRYQHAAFRTHRHSQHEWHENAKHKSKRLFM